MKGFEDIERQVGELQMDMGSSVDEQILADAFAALEESFKAEAVGREPSIWQAVFARPLAKVAVAVAVIIVGLVTVVSLLPGPEPKPEPPPLEFAGYRAEQIQRAAEMAAAGDVEGLMAMLEEEPFENKVLAAICLGEMGDSRALPRLQRWYLLAQSGSAQLPEGLAENPFAGPIQKIEERLQKQKQPVGSGDVNALDAIEVNEPAEDANKVVEDVNAVPPTAAEQDEGVLELLVVHTDTNEPMEQVTVNVKVQRAGPDYCWQGLTDERGRCGINVNDLDTEYVQIHVTKNEFVPVQLTFSRQETAVLIELPKKYKISLEPGTSIGGFIENEEGEPIEKATVYVFALPKRDHERADRINVRDYAIETDSDGFWRCDVVPNDCKQAHIRLSHPNYVGDDSYGRTATPSMESLRSMAAVMVMARGVHIPGRVLDAESNPIQGAEVLAGGARAPRFPDGPHVETDGEGRFRSGQVRKGVTVLTVTATGYGPELSEVMAAEGMEPVEFRLGKGLTIRGRVVDTENRALKGVHISADQWRGYVTLDWTDKTKGNGYFEWNEAPADEVRLRFYKEGYMSVGVPLSAHADEYLIVMHAPLRISGTVVDAGTNEPVIRFTIIPGIKFQTSDRVSWQRREAVEVDSGRYEHTFTNAYDGHYLRIEADGYLPGVSRVFFEDEGDVTYDFRLQPGEGPSGIVYEPNGVAAAGAEVFVVRASRMLHFENGRCDDDPDVIGAERVQTGTDGGFELRPISEDYKLVVIHPSGFAEVAGRRVEQTGQIELDRWGSVEGVLRIGSEPGAKQTVHLYCRDSHNDPNLLNYSFGCTVATDEAGRFVMEQVMPGRMRIARRIMREDGRAEVHSAPEDVEVVAGETAYVEIGGAGRVITGRLGPPAGYEASIIWSVQTGRVRSKGPTEADYAQIYADTVLPRPADFEAMTVVEVLKWFENFQQSEQGREFTRQIAAKIEEKFGSYPSRDYSFFIAVDGSFEIEDVLPGTYILVVRAYEAGPYGHPDYDQPIGWVEYEFVVPDSPDADAEAPIELGVIPLDKEKELAPGEMAPPFQVDALEGGLIRLSDFAGKVVLINFWRISAPLDELDQAMDEIKRIHEKFGADARFEVVGVTMSHRLGLYDDLAGKYVKEKQLQWKQGIAGLGDEHVLRSLRSYGVRWWLGNVLVGADGRIIASELSADDLQATVAEALAAPPDAAEQSPQAQW